MPKRENVSLRIVEWLQEHEGETVTCKQIAHALAGGDEIKIKSVSNLVSKICDTYPCFFRIAHGRYVWDENQDNWGNYNYRTRADIVMDYLENLPDGQRFVKYTKMMEDLDVNYNELLNILTSVQSSGKGEILRYQVVEIVKTRKERNHE